MINYSLLLEKHYYSRVVIQLGVLLVLLSVLSIFYYNGFEGNQHDVNEFIIPARDEWKKIFFFTPFYGRMDSWEKIFRRIITGQCEESRCTFISNGSQIAHADAVIFSSVDLPARKMLNGEWLRKRSDNQAWVFFSMNPPTYQAKKLNLKGYDSFFNWTMTYKRDSDIYSPYGLTVKRPDGYSQHHMKEELFEKPLDFRSANFLKRPNLVVSFLGKCRTPSNREMFIKKLKKYIPVDTFGDCGKSIERRKISLVSASYPTIVDKMELIIPKYYFYLALENSLCEDYISEAFYRALRLGSVPIVFGSRVKYDELAPLNSFIDASKFSSLKDLSSYLRTVSKNSSLYVKYHEWREEYEVKMGYPYDTLPCDLCSQLYKKGVRKVKDDLSSWFSQNKCDPIETEDL